MRRQRPRSGAARAPAPKRPLIRTPGRNGRSRACPRPIPECRSWKRPGRHLPLHGQKRQQCRIRFPSDAGSQRNGTSKRGLVLLGSQAGASHSCNLRNVDSSLALLANVSDGPRGSLQCQLSPGLRAYRSLPRSEPERSTVSAPAPIFPLSAARQRRVEWIMPPLSEAPVTTGANLHRCQSWQLGHATFARRRNVE
jgi:hypothetical protein